MATFLAYPSFVLVHLVAAYQLGLVAAAYLVVAAFVVAAYLDTYFVTLTHLL